MSLADFSPNVLAMRLFGYALIASLLVFGGCRWQAKLDAGEIAEAKAATAKAAENLRIASGALSANAAKYREIDAANAANAAIAESQRKAALQAAAKAEADKLTFAKVIADMQAQAERDRLVCTVEEARICGTPLR